MCRGGGKSCETTLNFGFTGGEVSLGGLQFSRQAVGTEAIHLGLHFFELGLMLQALGLDGGGFGKGLNADFLQTLLESVLGLVRYSTRFCE